MIEHRITVENEARVDQPEGDTRPPVTFRNEAVESVGFGAHLVDWNLPLDDAIDAVAKAAAGN